MDNKHSEQSPIDNSEKPSSVIVDIVVKTLATLAIGVLVMYSGLI
jgi:hypothetical protein